LNLAEKGVTFEQYLAERFPAADARKFGTVSLRELCLKRIDAMQKYLQ